MKKNREKVTVFIQQKEHPNDFWVDNGVLFCIFCDHSVEWNRKSTIDNHCKSKAHLTKKKLYENNNRTNYQQTLHSSLSANEKKKAVIEDLIRAFTGADIPLEKVNALLSFFKKYMQEGGAILQAVTLRQTYLPCIFLQHYEDLILIFKERSVAIITTFQIPLSSSRLFVTDSAAYMKKCFREVLKPLMPQLIHISCYAHIINLVG